MDNDTIKVLAKEGSFEELRAESPEILAKALKWLKKKIEADIENPEQESFCDFVKFFIGSGANVDHESMIDCGRAWKLKRTESIGSLSLSPESPAAPMMKEISELAPPPAMIVVEETDGEQQSSGGNADKKKGGFKMPSKKVGFRAPGVVVAVSPSSSPKASKSSKGKEKKGGAKSHPSQKLSSTKKDPNAPKKAPSAYLLFCGDKREAVKQANPDMKQPDLLKELGAMWKAADSEERAPFEAMSIEKKNEYTKAIAQYRIDNPNSARFVKVPKAKASSTSSSSKGADREKKEKKDKKRSLKRLDEEYDEMEIAAEDAAADAVLFPDGTTTATTATPSKSSSGSSHRGTSKRKAGAKAHASMQRLASLESSKHIVATDGHSQDSQDSQEDDEDEEEMPRKHGKKKTTGKSKGASFSSSAADTVTNVALRQRQNVARSGDSAFAIPVMKGIKQKHLPRADDLLNSRLRLSRRGVFPADFLPECNQQVTLVLEPYRDFIQSLTTLPLPAKAGGEGGDTLSSRLGLAREDLTLIEVVTTHSHLSRRHVIKASVTAIRRVHPSGDLPDANVSLVDLLVDDAEFEGQEEVEEGGDAVTILFAPLSSQALTVDQFLLETRIFDSCLQQPFLRIGAQVRRCFSPPEDGDYGFQGSGPQGEEETEEENGEGAPCQWIEGQVYSVREDLKQDPYLAVKVVWLSQDMDDPALSWVYAYTQTDNQCSPWDLQQSEFVLPSLQQRRLPRALTVGLLRASSVLDYLMSLDFTSVFRYDLGKQAASEYTQALPDLQDRVDLHTINKWTQKGRYDATSSSLSDADADEESEGNVGMATLFRDLERMVHAGLKFNECNENFLPWRQVEMTQQALADLKRDLARAHPHLTCLRDSVAQDREREREAIAIAASQVIEV